MGPGGRLDRRTFLRGGVGVALAAGVSARGGAAAATDPGPGPYGAIDGRSPDDNGLILPEGFLSRVVAVSGDPVGGTGYEWPLFPGGAATFPDDDGGGWYYACNSVVYDYLTPWRPMGGASAIHFDQSGAVQDAYRILEGSHSNRDGGPTPWGTWLSCEQDFDGDGLIWECDPTGARPGVAHEAMGHRSHGSAAVDSTNGVVYMTEAERDGLLYRFTPEVGGDLSAGHLEAMVLEAGSTVRWEAVTDPTGSGTPARRQVPGAFVTPIGGGIWYRDGWVWFTTSLDNRVHALDLVNQRYLVVWDGIGNRQPLVGIAGLTVAPASADLFVAEDRGNMELVLIGAEGDVAPFARFADPTHRLSEVTGPCFDPAGERLYFSSLRGPGSRLTRDVIADIDWGDAPEGLMVGVTYEVTGPFRGVATAVQEIPASPTSVPVASAAGDPPAVATTTAASTLPTTLVTTTVPAVTVPRPVETLAASVQQDTVGESSRRGTGVALAAGIAVLGGVLAVRRRGRGDRDGGGSDERGS